MRPLHLVLLTLIGFSAAACTGADASPRTTALVAPPTTPSPTTTTDPPATPAPTTVATPTTAAPTTQPTTAPADPAQVIAERHTAFGKVVDECSLDPGTCYPAVSFTEFVSPESAQYKFYAEARDGLVEEGQRITQLDRVKRRVVVAEFEEGGATGHTVSCVEHGGVYIQSNNGTLPDLVVYWREDFLWERIDDRWISTSGILTALDPEGDGECSF